MNKNANKDSKSAAVEIKGSPSIFTLTFVIEIVGIDVFHDCNEGWLDLASGPAQGMKIQYQLSPGYSYDVEIMIWPHVAKIWCATNCGWVRTWYFLQRRWLAFTIRHSVPVMVADFRYQDITATTSIGLGTLSANAKADKTFEVYLPKLLFGERRQFAPVSVQEEEISLKTFMLDLIWSCITAFIPISDYDGPFNTPQPVTGKRHQDAVLDHLTETILNRSMESTKPKDPKAKFEITLSGDEIICGTGRIIPFRNFGEKPSDTGEVIALISSTNLPAQHDNPVVFINIGKLTDVPVNELIKHKISHIYTRWTLSDEVHSSELQDIEAFGDTDIDFDDHHSVSLPQNLAAEAITSFQDDVYKIEIRGIRQISTIKDSPSFFGYKKEDREFGKSVPPTQPSNETDILIATTKIDAKCLSKSLNTFMRGEYPIFPPEISIVPMHRERICTNDINAIRLPQTPNIVVQAGVILKAQMTLEVSIGLVGCKPTIQPERYCRLFCLIKDSEAVMTTLRHITEINENMVENELRDELLTGFALDTGDTVFLYVEGKRDGKILHMWDVIEEFYPKVKPVFTTSAQYGSRLYPELLKTAMPFNVLKMFVPLSVLLACPPIYARPALPLPTRFAVLKIDRLIASKLLTTPSSSDMPTSAELRSFRLELCVAPRPPPVVMPSSPSGPAKTYISNRSVATDPYSIPTVFPPFFHIFLQLYRIHQSLFPGSTGNKAIHQNNDKQEEQIIMTHVHQKIP